MGTPDSMGWIALFCIAAVPAALLIVLAGGAVRSFRAGYKKTALYDTVAFLALFSLMTGVVLVFGFK